MGKSASLNAARGDVIVPNVCQDEHSHNTYFFANCFSAADVSPTLKYGTVLDNQKAICVLGTFLQNAHVMDIFFSEGFGDIEMELGNFCSALYEISRPKRFPSDEIVNLYTPAGRLWRAALRLGYPHVAREKPRRGDAVVLRDGLDLRLLGGGSQEDNDVGKQVSDGGWGMRGTQALRRLGDQAIRQLGTQVLRQSGTQAIRYSGA